MQSLAAHTETAAVGKARVHRTAGAMKADAAKFRAERTRYFNPDLRRRRATVRHQAFAASLIDGWTISIRYHDAESLSSGRDRRRQSCRPTANDKYIRIEHLKIQNVALVIRRS